MSQTSVEDRPLSRQAMMNVVLWTVCCFGAIGMATLPGNLYLRLIGWIGTSILLAASGTPWAIAAAHEKD